jgi:hypothetical protein
MMDTRNKIDVSKADIREVVRAAYDLSSPQGLGFLHYTPGPLSDAEIDDLLSRPNNFIAASLDYVKGRAVKLTIWKHEDKTWIYDDWFDHSDQQLRALLERVGIDPAAALSKARAK